MAGQWILKMAAITAVVGCIPSNNWTTYLFGNICGLILPVKISCGYLIGFLAYMGWKQVPDRKKDRPLSITVCPIWAMILKVPIWGSERVSCGWTQYHKWIVTSKIWLLKARIRCKTLNIYLSPESWEIKWKLVSNHSTGQLFHFMLCSTLVLLYSVCSHVSLHYHVVLMHK